MTKVDDISGEEMAFYRAIWTAPDDDAPRLVYADWLDENAGTVRCPACYNLHHEYSTRTDGLPVYWCGRCNEGTRLVPDGREAYATYIRESVRKFREPGYVAKPSNHRLVPIYMGLTYSRGMPSHLNTTLPEWYFNRQFLCFYPITINVQDRLPWRAVDRTTDIQGRMITWTFGGVGGSSSLPLDLYDHMLRVLDTKAGGLKCRVTVNSDKRMISFSRIYAAFEILGDALLHEARTNLIDNHKSYESEFLPVEPDPPPLF